MGTHLAVNAITLVLAREFGELEERMREFTRAKARQVFGRNKAMVFGSAQPAAAWIGESMVIARDGDEVVWLQEVLPAAPPTYKPQSAADILCLDLHKFGIAGATSWVRDAQSSIADDQWPLCIVALGNPGDLGVKDLWRISEELEPAGAIFHRWPKNCESFADAFHRFGESVKSIYGPFNCELAVRPR